MNKYFNIDARTILTLGRDSIKNHTTALLELVKNSYDADATKVWIDIFCRSSRKYIRIVDNGCGMTEDGIDKYWLRIGYSEKRTNRFSSKKRRKTGEKGIGRISSDRLGSILNLKTKSKNSNIIGIAINWDDFDVEGKDLTSVPIKILDNPQMSNLMSKNSNSKTGTELEINNLRQNWKKNDIENLYNELSILSPPFKKAIDFEIYLNNDIAEEYNGKITSSFLGNAEIELNAECNGKEIMYTLKDRFTKRPLEKKTITWSQLQQIFYASKYEKTFETPIFGPVSLTLMFWTRESSSIFTENLRLSDLRTFLDRNAGVKIYRDNIRVKPYGNPKNPEGDWLGLAERKTRDPAGVGRPSWVVSANQVAGAIFFSRDSNPNLTDGSSREGLIHDDAFIQLKSLVLGCLRILEIHRHEVYIKSETSEKKLSSPKEDVKVLNTELKILKKDLTALKKHISKNSHRPVQRTIDQVTNVLETIPKVKESMNEAVSQLTVFRGLATIGIASAVFGHETQTSIANFISSVHTAKNILEKIPDKNEAVLSEISKSIKYAEQVSSWGTFALARVQRDKRKKRKISITKILNTTLNQVKPVFKAIDIEFQTNFDEVECSTFAMDIEAILLNLLTNAYEACKQKIRKRIINITLKKEEINKISGYSISISDTGPGINEQFKKMIWKPLFSTRVDQEGKEVGTGLGLAIIDSIVKDLNGEKRVDNDPILKGARFYIWLPFK